MHILQLGLSFKTSPLEVREALYFPPEREGEVGQHLNGAYTGLVVLSTCHRTELYLECDDWEYSLQHCRDLLAQKGSLQEEQLQRYTYYATDLEAARHLLGVASGLDSMVIGEEQVLGQVGRAYERSLRRQQTSPLLSLLFRHALAVGKKVRTETGLGKRPASIGSAVRALAREVIGPLDTATALLIGGGEMGTEVGKGLTIGKIGRLLLVSRTYARAQELAAILGGTPVDLGQMGEILEQCDMVVAASSAPHYVMSEEAVRKAASRRKKPLLLIDLGMPRNISPEVALVPGVVLHKIDDLQRVVERELMAEQEDMERAEALVEEGLHQFRGWLALRPVEETMGALGRELEAIRRGELSRALPKLSSLSAQEMAVLEAMTKAMVKKFLFVPAKALRERIPAEEANRYLRAIEELFLREEGPSPNGRHPQALGQEERCPQGTRPG